MITVVFNLVLGVALALAVAMFVIFTRETVAARRLVAVADGPDAIAVAKQKVALSHGAEFVAVVFAVGVIIGFVIIN